MTETTPKRITKQRAEALLDAAARGIDEQIRDLENEYGIRLHLDGSVSGTVKADPDELERAEKHIGVRIDKLRRAIDALAILRRRYG